MKLPEKEMKKAKKVLKNDWRIGKMRFICRIFDNAGKNDLTSEDVVAAYHSNYGEMDDATILGLLKRMTDLKLLRRERRTVKQYPEGHVKSTNRYFYTATAQIWSRMKELENEQMDMTLEIVEKGLSDKEAESLRKKVKAAQDLMKPAVPIVAPAPTVVPTVEPITKERVEKMFEHLSFAEALVKVYSGFKIVSAVSGNVYSMMDEGNLKGITCSAKPGAIISFFPSNEMEGAWRLMESPKPCPYCGSVMKLVQYDGGNMCYYMCSNDDCKSVGPKARTPEEAVKKLNKRC